MSCGFLGCINLLLGQGLNSNRHLLKGVGGAPLSLKGEGGGGGGGGARPVGAHDSKFTKHTVTLRILYCSPNTPNNISTPNMSVHSQHKQLYDPPSAYTLTSYSPLTTYQYTLATVYTFPMTLHTSIDGAGVPYTYLIFVPLGNEGITSYTTHAQNWLAWYKVLLKVST